MGELASGVCHTSKGLVLLQDKLRKLKSAHILRSLAQKTDFSVAAVELVCCLICMKGNLAVPPSHVLYLTSNLTDTD